MKIELARAIINPKWDFSLINIWLNGRVLSPKKKAIRIISNCLS